MAPFRRQPAPSRLRHGEVILLMLLALLAPAALSAAETPSLLLQRETYRHNIDQLLVETQAILDLLAQKPLDEGSVPPEAGAPLPATTPWQAEDEGKKTGPVMPQPEAMKPQPEDGQERADEEDPLPPDTVGGLPQAVRDQMEMRLFTIGGLCQRLHLPKDSFQHRQMNPEDALPDIATELRDLQRQAKALRESLETPLLSPEDSLAASDRTGMTMPLIARMQRGLEEERGESWFTGQLKRLGAWLGDLLREFFKGVDGPGEGFGERMKNTFMALAITLFVVLLLLLGFLVVRVLRSLPAARPLAPQEPPTVYPAEERLVDNVYWRRAEQELAAGRLREALRSFFHAWLFMLHEGFKTPLPHRDETNHEWHRRSHEAIPPLARQDTLAILGLFDLHWYGLTAPDPGRVAQFRDTLRDLMRRGGGRP